MTETLSAPASSTACASSARPDPAADRERDEDVVGAAAGQVDDRVALLVRGGDVEEHELVGALGLVALGELHGVAGVADVDEVRALHDAALVHVEAGMTRLSSIEQLVYLADGEPALIERLARHDPGEIGEAQ